MKIGRLTTNQGVPSRQPEFAEGRAARTDPARRLHPAREDHPLRPRTHSRARRACARLGRARLLRGLRALTELTRAAPFQAAGKITPVFVRFSTVAGERGSTDTARDVRGFAVKFYTDEGNWDLVGNNIPVFFIQDAMKFPDLVHAVKPEPHNGCRRRPRRTTPSGTSSR
jgi:catalase